MNQPLYKLAQFKKLPEHQFMDAETLSWISRNIPEEIKNIDYSIIKNRFKKKFINLTEYAPKIEWFENKLIAKGIHGILHLYRVTSYLIILNILLDLKLDENSLYFMGLFHDIKRLNDKNDISHGKKSAIWIEQNKDMIEKFLNKKISDETFINISLAISLHDIDCDNKKYTQNQLKYINILKTSDALDRYRLPKIKWWLNDSYLIIKPPVNIKAFAFNLILYTENNKLKFIPLKQSIKCFLRI